MQKPLMYLAWVQSLVATLGSIFFSEVLHFPPCTLCWYQRVCMYPLVVLLAMAIAREEYALMRPYALVLSSVGAVIAIYHNLLYYQVLPQSYATCTAGISCTTAYISWFGFITLPLLSLVSFLVIIGLLAYALPSQKSSSTHST